DAVLSDAMMPGMSGVELATVLEAEHPGLPVLIMSGYTEDAVARAGQLTPNTRFVEKPFTVHELSRALADALADSSGPELPGSGFDGGTTRRGDRKIRAF
ncbi:MAG TPA: response regulator, partial [Gemmatimonadaceae bacterium]